MEILITFGVLGVGIFNAILLVLLLLKEKSVKHDEKIDEEMVFRSARRKSNTIIEKAITRADAIIAQAYTKGGEVLEKAQKGEEILKNEYQEDLKKLTLELTQELEENEKKAEKQYAAFLASLSATIESHVKNSQGMLENKGAEALEETQKHIRAFVDDVHQKMKEEITKEIESAKAAVEEYKRTRMTALDDNIVDIIEQTMKLTLGKTLTLSEHTDLVYKALEQAKRDSFFNI